jgi:hypothetical protein
MTYWLGMAEPGKIVESRGRIGMNLAKNLSSDQ